MNEADQEFGSPVILGAGLGESDTFSSNHSIPDIHRHFLEYAVCCIRSTASLHGEYIVYSLVESFSDKSSLGVMSSLTPMVAHQHPGAGNPHPHGWVQFQQTSFLHHHHQASGLPMPITNGAGRFDTQRSMPRFVPPGRVYDPNPGFSHYAESSPVNYSMLGAEIMFLIFRCHNGLYVYIAFPPQAHHELL
ncbi:Transferrin receptor protein 1 [Bienertia sinuspersici]